MFKEELILILYNLLQKIEQGTLPNSFCEAIIILTTKIKSRHYTHKRKLQTKISNG